MRTVILHYHLFKNAGTSIDRILQHNFPDGWEIREFPGQGGNNTALVREWIEKTPQGIAFSSHTMLGPLPDGDGLRIIPILLLREPLARIASAYRFERRQEAQTKGAILAKRHSFGGYVRARLAMPGDRQCRDFQTARLATHSPGKAPELDRAKATLALFQKRGVVGLVSDFDQAMADLADRLSAHWPDIDVPAMRANRAKGRAPETSKALRALLLRSNAQDLALLEELQSLRRAA